MHSFPRAVPLLAVAAAVIAAPAALAAQPRLLSAKQFDFRTAVNAKRSCAVRAASGAGVLTRRLTSPATGAVSVRTSGRPGSDWDVGIVDRRTGHVLNGVASAGSDDYFEALVTKGQKLRVQACRLSGSGGVNVRVRFARGATGTDAAADEKVRLVRVRLGSQLDRDRIAALGLDTSDHATAEHWDILLHSEADAARLRGAGFAFTTLQADQLRHDRGNRRREVAAQARVRAARRRGRAAQAASALPSGRASYRTLAEINDELRTLAQQNPGLVRLITVGTSRLGKPIQGIEIATNVTDQGDGRPAYVQVGTHHAREWPANEVTLEWGYELINNARTAAHDPNLDAIVSRARTFVIPVLNVDGFDVTIESEGLNPDGSYEDPVNTGGETGRETSGNQSIGSGAYKRKTCYDPDPALQAIPCILRTSYHATPNPADTDANFPDRGVDPNRNYGVEWGGPGSASAVTDLTYHGPTPFSEPETEAFRRWLRDRNPTVLITNHTFSGLMLRPPGTSDFGPTPDEFRMRLLGDAMAAEVDYVSQFSYQLYDTTGTTDDYVYDGLGSYSFTPEIGKEEFHPAYPAVVTEYVGQGGGLDGLRRSFTYAGLAAINTGQYSEVPGAGTNGLPALPRTHAVIAGTAPAGRTLTLTKTISYKTSSRPDDDNQVNGPLTITEPRTLRLRVRNDGKFVWHVNPSSQPRSGATTPWRLTCQNGNGPVLESRDVYVARDQTVNVALTCGTASTSPAPECTGPDGFDKVNATRRGRGLRISFTRKVANPVTIDVFRRSVGRRITKLRRVKHFSGRARSFTWRPKSLRNGVYIVRFRIRDAGGRVDTRRIVIERKRGKFARRGDFILNDTCSP